MTVHRTQLPLLISIVTSIYSVDFHPKEPYVATAGGGRFLSPLLSVVDSNVFIWATDPIFSEEKEDDENTDRLLSTLRGHTNEVTCCRWSPDGRYASRFCLIRSYLATASDDETIRIWIQDMDYVEVYFVCDE